MTSQSAAFVLDYVMLTRMLPKMLLPGGILELMVYSQQVRPLCPTGNWCEAHETWETDTYRDSQNPSQQMIQGYCCLMVLGGWHIITLKVCLSERYLVAGPTPPLAIGQKETQKDFPSFLAIDHWSHFQLDQKRHMILYYSLLTNYTEHHRQASGLAGLRNELRS